MATVSAPAASEYSATTTRPPSAANISAATRPIPPPPPVMIETLSLSRMLSPLPSRPNRVALAPCAPLRPGRQHPFDDLRGCVQPATLLGAEGIDHRGQRRDPPIATPQQQRPPGDARLDPDDATIGRIGEALDETVGHHAG